MELYSASFQQNVRTYSNNPNNFIERNFRTDFKDIFLKARNNVQQQIISRVKRKDRYAAHTEINCDEKKKYLNASFDLPYNPKPVSSPFSEFHRLGVPYALTFESKLMYF